MRTLLLTSGKLYYELDAYRTKHAITDTAIVRLEKLYPVPRRTLEHVLSNYPGVTDVRWVQEEPANQGAWTFLALALPEMIPRLTGIKTGFAAGDGRAVGRVRPGARGRAGRGHRRRVRRCHTVNHPTATSSTPDNDHGRP